MSVSNWGALWDPTGLLPAVVSLATSVSETVKPECSFEQQHVELMAI